MKIKILAYLGYIFLFCLGKSLRLKVIGEENFLKLKQQNKPVILITWHGLMYIPVYYLRHRGIFGIVSPSSDGDFFAKFFSNFGFEVLRGSSRKGGISALKNSLKVLKENHCLAVTPDGPIGPVYEVKEGVVYLAKKLNCPIIPIGVSYKFTKTLNTWDKAKIPFPFTKTIIYFDKEIFVPDDISLSQFAEYKNIIKNKLANAVKKAESYL